MEIKQGTNSFYIGENEENPKAQIHFVESDNQHQFIVDHTEVSEELSGQGIGKQLVEKMVEFARQENRSIIAECPYAEKIMEKNPSFQDVLAN